MIIRAALGPASGRGKEGGGGMQRSATLSPDVTSQSSLGMGESAPRKRHSQGASSSPCPSSRGRCDQLLWDPALLESCPGSDTLPRAGQSLPWFHIKILQDAAFMYFSEGFFTRSWWPSCFPIPPQYLPSNLPAPKSCLACFLHPVEPPPSSVFWNPTSRSSLSFKTTSFRKLS